MACLSCIISILVPVSIWFVYMDIEFLTKINSVPFSFLFKTHMVCNLIFWHPWISCSSCEAAIHSMHQFYESPNTEVVILVHATNDFNSSHNRQLAFHNISHNCPKW